MPMRYFATFAASASASAFCFLRVVQLTLTIIFRPFPQALKPRYAVVDGPRHVRVDCVNNHLRLVRQLPCRKLVLIPKRCVNEQLLHKNLGNQVPAGVALVVFSHRQMKKCFAVNISAIAVAPCRKFVSAVATVPSLCVDVGALGSRKKGAQYVGGRRVVVDAKDATKVRILWLTESIVKSISVLSCKADLASR